MSAIIRTTSAVSQIVPTPRRAEIATRFATASDLAFLDELQKRYGKALGFFPRAQMQGYVENQWVLIAEDAATKQPLGYCASRDRYLKRDELGVVYQLCVQPGFQRGLIGASLIKEVFERSAYGCRLYCCWCAQDLAANYFWESLGFVPIAFRGGSGTKKGPGGRPRVHIFWQRRIREGDTGERATPWWFPAKTDQGAMREDRLVLPIPPGLRWSDPMPVLKSSSSGETGSPTTDRRGPPKPRRLREPEIGSRGGPQQPTTRQRAGARFGRPTAAPVVAVEAAPASRSEPKIRPVRPKVTIDPHMVAKARELRDRYLEHVNGEQVNDRLLLAPSGKYDVSRALPSAIRDPQPAIPALLPAA